MTGVVNFENVSVLVADPDEYSRGILSQSLRGFGVTRQIHVDSVDLARKRFADQPVDLCIFETKFPDGTGAALVEWARRQETEKRYLPIIITTGFTPISQIFAARDSGANAVVKKPLSSQTLLKHILWSASDTRAFLDGPTYVGPDRRFSFQGIPGGKGRRSTDLSEDVGDSHEPNMSEDELESLWTPTKVAL